MTWKTIYIPTIREGIIAYKCCTFNAGIDILYRSLFQVNIYVKVLVVQLMGTKMRHNMKINAELNECIIYHQMRRAKIYV